MMASTCFYQKAAEAGLTCGQITDYLSRKRFTESAMEAMKSGAEKALDTYDDEAQFMKEIPGALFQAISTAMDLELEDYQDELAAARVHVLQATQEISEQRDKWEHNGEYDIKRSIQEFNDFRGALQVAKALIANGASPETMQQVMRHSFILTDLNASFSFGKALIEACPPGTLQETLQNMHQTQFG